MREGVKVHRCHVAGCEEEVEPRLLMCKRHWYMVPTSLRVRVWETYRPGQEIDKETTEAYREAAQAAVESVAATERVLRGER